MATNSDTINRLIAKKLVELVTHPDFVYADEMIKILTVLIGDLENNEGQYWLSRSAMEEPEKEEPKYEPLRRVIQLQGFSESLECFSIKVKNRLDVRSGLVLVEISPDVKREDALLRLKNIVAYIEENQLEWPSAEMLDDIGTSRHEDDSPFLY